MRKLYVVRLTKQERVELQSVVKKLKGTGQKVRRAQILLKADAAAEEWRRSGHEVTAAVPVEPPRKKR